MYPPPVFRDDDPAVAHALIDAHPFATVVTVADGAPVVSHVPLLRDGDALIGHVSRRNDQARPAAALAIFQGPHAYVSPTWYGDPATQVPTWNYAVVHVRGTLELLDGPATAAALDVLVARFEPAWRADPALRDALLSAIVGIRIPMTRVEARLKLSQNREPADIERVIGGIDPDVAAWMRRVSPSRSG